MRPPTAAELQAAEIAALREKLKRYTEGTVTHNAILQRIADIEAQAASHAAEVQRQKDHFAAHASRGALLAAHIQHGE